MFTDLSLVIEWSVWLYALMAKIMFIWMGIVIVRSFRMTGGVWRELDKVIKNFRTWNVIRGIRWSVYWKNFDNCDEFNLFKCKDIKMNYLEGFIGSTDNIHLQHYRVFFIYILLTDLTIIDVSLNGILQIVPVIFFCSRTVLSIWQ